jgi:hypothetical protein
LTINTKIEWLVNEGDIKSIEAFGINYNGKLKWFHMNPKDILKLYKILGEQVTFMNIQKIYFPVRLLGHGA